MVCAIFYTFSTHLSPSRDVFDKFQAFKTGYNNEGMRNVTHT